MKLFCEKPIKYQLQETKTLLNNDNNVLFHLLKNEPGYFNVNLSFINYNKFFRAYQGAQKT